MLHHVSNKRRGFTMVELILVMTIMTLIGLFSAMMIWNVHDNAKRRETEATIRLISIALDQYKHDIGHYPLGDGASMVAALTGTGTGWKAAGMEWFPNRKAPLTDAWGMSIQYCSHEEYESSGRGVERKPKLAQYYNPFTYQIYSMGPNMKTWPVSGTDADGSPYTPRLCGTEEDDIRNWEHAEFHAPADYQ